MNSHPKTILGAIVAGIFAVTAVSPALSQETSIVKVGDYRDWSAYRANTNDGWNCYIYSVPIASEASRENIRRDPVYLFVANLPDLQIVEEVSVVFGYPLKRDQAPIIEVDGRTFTLRGQGEDAVLESEDDNQVLVQAMKRGSTLTLRGESTRGTKTIDTFSLSGVTAGLRAVEDCG